MEQMLGVYHELCGGRCRLCLSRCVHGFEDCERFGPSCCRVLIWVEWMLVWTERDRITYSGFDPDHVVLGENLRDWFSWWWSDVGCVAGG